MQLQGSVVATNNNPHHTSSAAPGIHSARSWSDRDRPRIVIPGMTVRRADLQVLIGTQAAEQDAHRPFNALDPEPIGLIQYVQEHVRVGQELVVVYLDNPIDISQCINGALPLGSLCPQGMIGVLPISPNDPGDSP
ncbi:hypothetical protein SDC9_136214 [bioreactor metagenome]|uniref:Uncharacterized protein n=1 Tax=bioreactor metagenome TaxID=1076179 RepID=A0A645DIG4_9ZZZZ